jgi:PPP family 3-phenylpropionic acid transporter
MLAWIGKFQLKKTRNLVLSKSNPLRAAFLFGFASLASWMPLFNVWLEDAGLSGIQIGYVAAIPWIVVLILQPVWGIIADWYGKILCLNTALIFAVVFFITLPVLSKGLATIAVFTLFLAIFNTPVLPLLDSIALDHVDSVEGISYSNIRFWGAPGYGLGALLTGWLIPKFGVQVAFFTGAAFLLMVIFSIRRYHPKINAAKSIDIEFKGLNKVISNKLLIFFLAIIVIVAISQSAITFFLTLYMRQIGASPKITGTAISIQAFSELPFYFIAAWLLRKIKPDRVVLIAIFGTAVRLFFYSVNDNPNTVLFIETMNGITWTLLWIASVEFVNEMVPARFRTAGQSLLWAAYFGAGSILGSIISGRLYQDMEMQKVYSKNSMAILLVAIIATVIFFIRKKKKQLINGSNIG